MDRFLDDNESAASSRASSPHNFSTTRTRVGNGYLPNQSSTTSSTHTTVHSVPSGSSHSTVSMMSGMSHSSHSHNHHHHHHYQHHTQGSHGSTQTSPGKPPQLLQHCVPTSVIVSSQERNESPAKRPRMDHENIPRLISSTSSKPPPLKPIASSTPGSSVHKPSYGDRSHMVESSQNIHRSQGNTTTDLTRLSGSESYHHKA